MMKDMLERLIALVLLIIISPVLIAIWVAIKLDDGAPMFFKQIRTGKNKKDFYIFKIRTMVRGADKLKKKLSKFNETDGPVFKIYNDPRHTKVGRFLSHTGLDELPQLINILKGEMSFVGPRPLPVSEAKKIPKKYEARFDVKPGITSGWVVGGAHELTFKQWMEKDLEDVAKNGFIHNFLIGVKTVFFLLRLSFGKSKTYFVFVSFFFIFLVGLGLRVYFAISKTMWADEFFYFSIAVESSIKQLVFIEHWIKDNPPGFLLFVKFWAQFGKNLFWLRLTGIISYTISFFVLYKILDRLEWVGRFVVLSFFSLSVFFINVNFWLSPYNFVLIFTLFQVKLLKDFIQGKFKEKKMKFIFLFAITNFLAINSHYSTIYLFFSYPFLLFYFSIKRRGLVATFIKALFVSLLMLIPNTGIFLLTAKEMGAIVSNSYLGRIWIKTFGYGDFLVYFLNRSVLRLNNIGATQNIFLGLLALFSLLCLKVKDKAGNIYFSLFVLFYLLSALLLIFFLKETSINSVMAERSYQIFHIGFYFLLASILFYSQKLKRSKIYPIVVGLFLATNIFIFKSFLYGDLFKTSPRIPADVLDAAICEKMGDKFLNNLNESLKNGYDRLYFVGDDERTAYFEDIVIDYYFKYDRRFDWIRDKYQRGKTIFLVKESLARGSDKHPLPKKNDKILIINFNRSLEDSGFISNATFLKDNEVDIIDFWSP